MNRGLFLSFYMKSIETLRRKYDCFVRSGNHVKALKVMQEITRLSAVQETTERVAVRDLYGALTAEERQKAAHACTKIMLCADILNAAAVDLQGIIHRADPGAELLLHKDVKQIVKLSDGIVKNVDSFKDEEFSYEFGEMGDRASLTLDNIIYTERVKNKMKNGR